MATIKNIGIKCASRSQARELAKTLPNGRVVDLAKHWENFVESQRVCQSVNVPVNTLRWVVLHDKIVNIKQNKGMLTAMITAGNVTKGREIKCNGKQISVMTKRGAIALQANCQAMGLVAQ